MGKNKKKKRKGFGAKDLALKILFLVLLTIQIIFLVVAFNAFNMMGYVWYITMSISSGVLALIVSSYIRT
jgi:hypothetical protein